MQENKYHILTSPVYLILLALYPHSLFCLSLYPCLELEELIEGEDIEDKKERKEM